MAKTRHVLGNRKIAKTLRKRQKTCHDQQCHKLSGLDFTLFELDFALSLTKSGKAAVVDEIFPDFLKNLGNSAKKTLLAVLISHGEKPK
ncbi:hypothetical protein TNCT_349641 [Trichonephila clavata]|uniref:Uncharacterized protein n=1 Tax=Trichonephila clavata TaxID=2740835 RepID=A0A8X6HXX0_TRICU|nr:hypothetical protein TNCT_349641 [Trichonephila clavata]